MPLDESACRATYRAATLSHNPGSRVEGRSVVADHDEPTPGPWFAHVRDLAKRLGVDVRCRSNAQIVEAIWQVAEPDVQRAWLAHGCQR